MPDESDSKELKDHEVGMARLSTGSEVVVLGDHIREAVTSAPLPTIANVTQSSRVHIGPKVEIINVRHQEVVKDLPLPHYLWDMVKGSSRAERISCGASVTALLVCIILIVYFTKLVKSTAEDVDVGPSDWFITRQMWLSMEFNRTEKLNSDYEPLKLVVIAHTVSQECHLYQNCVAELRNLQSYSIQSYNYDIPYNFLIGNDGRVYEGVGWGFVGAHTVGYNRCSLGVAFIGDYREGSASYAQLSSLQIERVHMLFAEGIRLGRLAADYHIVGARDLKSTISPGDNIYNNIQKWDHFNDGAIYSNKTCNEIQAMFKNTTETIKT